MNTIKAYKAFNRDMTCLNQKYKAGQVYEMEGKPILCEKGFHFCKDLVLTLQYYPVSDSITENHYAEVEILGDVEWEMPTKHKGVTNKIKILRVLSDKEVNEMVDDKSNSGHSNSGDRNSGHSNSGDRNSGDRNSGHWNSGDRNSGHWNSGHSNSGHSNSGNSNSGDRNSGDRNSGRWNSGDRNSGHWNSGDRNSGHWNSGRWNSGDRNSGDSNSGNSNSGNSNSGNSNSGRWNSTNNETGCFNSFQSKKIRVFNKKCDRDIWDDAYKPDFLFFEIEDNDYKSSFINSWERADKDDRERVKDLPNFDAETFLEISGIDLREKS